MSESTAEPTIGNKADVSHDCHCQICHRHHIAKRQGELTHEIVRSTSKIAIWHGIDWENVAAFMKPSFLIDHYCWEGEPYVALIRGGESLSDILFDITVDITFLNGILIGHDLSFCSLYDIATAVLELP